MKRLKNALCAYSWAWKTIIAILWMLWATQMYGYVREDITKRNAPLEAQASLMLSGFVADEVEAIRQSKGKFLSAQYFETLKKIERKRLQIERMMHVRPYTPEGQMQHLRALVTDYKEMAENGNGMMYYDWLRSGGAYGEEFRYTVQADGWLKTINMIVSWLAVLYFRTIPLVLLLYVVRMAQRRGILETILAGKVECIKAVVMWPIYFYKYPFNIIREIRVEAELRRMGSIFRRLNPQEKLLARTIAGSGEYQRCLDGLQSKHNGIACRSLLVVIIPAILFYFAFPAGAASVQSEQGSRDGPVIAQIVDGCCATTHIVTSDIVCAHHVHDACGVMDAIIAEVQSAKPVKNDRLQNLVPKEIALKIDHVPISRLFGLQVTRLYTN